MTRDLQPQRDIEREREREREKERERERETERKREQGLQLLVLRHYITRQYINTLKMHFCTEAVTHRRFYTHRSIYTQTLLHTEAFTRRRIYTLDTFTHIGF